MERKAIQLSCLPEGENNAAGIIVLCNDGEILFANFSWKQNLKWVELPSIPQPTHCVRRELIRDLLTQKDILRDYMSDGTVVENDVTFIVKELD